MAKGTRRQRSFKDNVRQGDRARALVGDNVRDAQVARQRNARTDKQKTVETVRRVGEYRKASDGNNSLINRKSQENLK